MLKWWKNFLEKLGQANKQVFPSGQRLDCCNLKSSNQPQDMKSKKTND